RTMASQVQHLETRLSLAETTCEFGAIHPWHDQAGDEEVKRTELGRKLQGFPAVDHPGCRVSGRSQHLFHELAYQDVAFDDQNPRRLERRSRLPLEWPSANSCPDRSDVMIHGAPLR